MDAINSAHKAYVQFDPLYFIYLQGVGVCIVQIMKWDTQEFCTTDLHFVNIHSWHIYMIYDSVYHFLVGLFGNIGNICFC